MQIEKLSGRENYNTWRFAVKTYLEHEELWNIVDPGSSEVDPKRDLKAKSKIILLVEPINYVHIENAKSAREVWTNLQNVFEDSGLSRKVGLLKDLINTTLDSCASVEEYVNKIICTAHKLRNISFKVDDEWLGTLMLAGLPENYKPMIMGIESSGIKISSDFIKTKLLQEVKVPENSVFFTKNKRSSHRSNQNQSKSKPKGPRCYSCNLYGHYRNECNVKKSDTKNNSGTKAFSAIFSAYTCIQEDDWVLDSGATSHISRRSDWMYDLEPPAIQRILVANSDAVTVRSTGKVNITTNIGTDEHLIQVRNVLYIPEVAANLLSVSQLTKNGCRVEFTCNGCNIYNCNNDLIATATLVNNMYKLNTVTGTACAVFTNESKADLYTWHRRMGHLNMTDLKKLESCAEGINITKHNEIPVCTPCCEGKQTRFPFPHSGSRANASLEIIHSDLCGAMETVSLGGARYFITFIDDYTRKVYVYFLKNKLDITSTFKKFKAQVENELGKRIKILRTDGGKEYCNKILCDFLADSGIRHQTTAPYTPQQNGLAEKMNRTLVERAKCMLFDANLSKGYWAEAVATAAYIINRSPSRVLAEVTPYEKWTGKKPNLSHLRVFGSKAMVHIPKQKRQKWDRKSQELLFIGYCENTKGYRLYDPRARKTIISRDVIFIEKCKTATAETEKSVISLPQLATIPLKTSVESTDNGFRRGEELKESPQAITISSFDSCETSNDSNDSFDKITLRPHQRKNINFLCIQQISDPLTVEEALSSNEALHWKRAMDEEYKSLMENNTWEITTLPQNKRAIPCKWVFKTKTNEEGKIIKYKARLVIKGCSQKKGIDYNEVFSPVVRYSSLRYLFAMAAKYDLDIILMDAVSAFLQGDIEEEIYMTQPPFYEKDEGVCLLRKSLYGLKQASRQWNKKLSATLKSMDLTQSKLDPCIYFKIVDDKNILFVAIYVDDLLIFTNNLESKKNIKEELNNKFKMKDLGDVSYCIGVHVERDRQNGIIYLDQKKYILEILNKFGMSDCKPVKTPMDINTKFKTSDDSKVLNNIPYQEIIGCLLYITQITRPDLCYVINTLSKFNNKPEMQHWLALKRVMRYLKGTQDYRLSYKQCHDEMMTHAYCDSDWATSEEDRRSCTGYTFLFQGGAISWNSKRQPTVALSTTEAEYMALSSCVQEAMWLKQLQEEFWPRLRDQAMVIYSDNQSSIKLSGSDGYHLRTKHIDVRHHFIRDKVMGGLVQISYVPTEVMVADILTKPTALPKLQYCTSKMGLNQCCIREDVEKYAA